MFGYSWEGGRESHKGRDEKRKTYVYGSNQVEYGGFFIPTQSPQVPIKYRFKN
jgi:hypothetical protein